MRKGNLTKNVTAYAQPATGGVVATSFAVNLPLSPGASTVTLVATTPAPESKTTTQHYAVPVGSSATVASLIYDPVGNLISQKSGTLGAEVTYAWDAANRLVKISKPGAVTEFVYDGLSRRVAEKFNGTVIKRWIWFNGDAQPAEERDANNAVTRRFYAGLGEQIGGTNFYYTVDHLGSVRELTDGTGAIRARYAYDPYGRRTKVSGDLEANFGYTGYYQHAPSGLSLALYRAYDSRLGRFISRDPIEEAGGSNLYRMVFNNPINAIDPLGLDAICLLDSDNAAAVGQGHAGALIGDDTNGWIYYNWSPQVGPNQTVINYATLADAVKDAEIARYEEFLRYSTSRLDDLRAKLKAGELFGRSYKPFTRNCGHVAGEIIKSAKPSFKVSSWRPKTIFSDNKYSADYSGTILNMASMPSTP
jgi:RHS repeat-associated protein